MSVMATKEQLIEHISKAKTKLAEATGKAENPRHDLDVRQQKKKMKRLTRKVAKIDYRIKKAEEKKKGKKEDAG